MRVRRCALVGLLLAACGDRSPPALWPEPSPPTLAQPIAEPVPASFGGAEASETPAADAGAEPSSRTEPAHAAPP